MILTKGTSEGESKLPEIFDRTFGIRVSKPKVSLETVNAFCSEMRKVKLGELSSKMAPGTDWVTMGVVTDKSECKKSGNGNEYMIWRVSDLTFGGQTVKVLLFGDCFRQYWKFQVGMTVLLNNPQWTEPNVTNRENEVILKLFKAAQIIELGFCPDFGFCQATKTDGETCKNAVNTSTTTFCPFHIQQRARQLATNRGALNRSYNLPPKKLRTFEEHQDGHTQLLSGDVKTVGGVQTGGGRIYTRSTSSIFQRRLNNRTTEVKAQQVEELNKLITEKPLGFGARNLLLKQQKEKENQSPRAEATVPSQSTSQKALNSMREFIHSQPQKAHSSTLTTKEQMKIKRAAETLKNTAKRTKITEKENNPKEENGKGTLLGKSFTDEEIHALLAKKSTHHRESMQEELDRQNAYFKHREIEEQIETNATSLMELKNCKVVTCLICGYTSQHQSTHCRSLGHEVKRHVADKRFFKCKICQRRTYCYDRMPSRACQGCGSKEFYRVALRDERKVLTEVEQLKIKEDEKNFSAVNH